MKRVLTAALLLAAVPAAAEEYGFDVMLGRALFDRAWIPAPASTKSADGLGPLFSARSCSACHGLRGLSPGSANPFALTLRLGHDPLYGDQIQAFAVPGVEGEGRLLIVDGPEGRDAHLADAPLGPLADSTPRSLRHAPTVSGIGLLAQVPEADILANTDPDDRDGDGISGRPNRLADGRLGRFGWKASHPTLADQNATAFALDLGLATPLRPAAWADCTEAQVSCRSAPQGGDETEPELAADMAQMVDVFVQAIPPPRSVHDPQGQALFAATGCAACHRPEWQVHPANAAEARTIAPYTDLLLHDMGEGLADGLAEGDALGSEWRTPPLWGIRERLAAGSPAFLHDGRASTLEAAIRWHAGEAMAAVRDFATLTDADRQRLLAFLSGL